MMYLPSYDTNQNSFDVPIIVLHYLAKDYARQSDDDKIVVDLLNLFALAEKTNEIERELHALESEIKLDESWLRAIKSKRFNLSVD